MGKEEIARNEQFHLFPQCFVLIQIIVSPFVHIFDIISVFAAEFEKPKIAILGKGLRKILTTEQINKDCSSLSFSLAVYSKSNWADFKFTIVPIFIINI